jgi:hypothetical protein
VLSHPRQVAGKCFNITAVCKADVIGNYDKISTENSNFSLQTRHGSAAHVRARKGNSLDAVFWNVTPYILVACYRRFREAFCLFLQGRRMSILQTEALCSFEIWEKICQITCKWFHQFTCCCPAIAAHFSGNDGKKLKLSL